MLVEVIRNNFEFGHRLLPFDRSCAIQVIANARIDAFELGVLSWRGGGVACPPVLAHHPALSRSWACGVLRAQQANAAERAHAVWYGGADGH